LGWSDGIDLEDECAPVPIWIDYFNINVDLYVLSLDRSTNFK
jgi:hypothetical protein